MTERQDIPLIGMPEEAPTPARKGETKSRPKSGVASVGAPKPDTKAVARPEAKPPARETKSIPRRKSGEDERLAAAETHVDEPTETKPAETKPADTKVPRTKEPAPLTLPPAATLGAAEDKPKMKGEDPNETQDSDDPAEPPTLPPSSSFSLKAEPSAPRKPAIVAEPTSRHSAPRGDDDSVLMHIRKIEERLRESKDAMAERDEAIAKAARLEHELAQANERIGALKGFEGEAKTLKEKLDASLLNSNMLATENGKLKMRMGELETLVKQGEERLKAVEEKIRKQETALANAKEARDDAQRRIEAALAALQGKAK
jgi:hypothetical protein